MEDGLDFETRNKWRGWLEKNHNKRDSTWLIFHKKGSGRKGITLAESVEEAICFGWIDGKLRKVDDTKFVVRFSSRKAKSVWSLINKERAERLIAAGKMTRAGLAKIDAAKEAGTWNKAYTNKARDEMPEELKKALMQDKIAWENFQKFANTYRNMYVGWVASAKTDETKKKRIAKVVDQAVRNKKQIFE